MQGLTGNVQRRQPFSTVNNRQDVSAATDMSSSNEGPDSSSAEFTKEEIEALLNEKMKSSKFDLKVLPSSKVLNWLIFFCQLVIYFAP